MADDKSPLLSAGSTQPITVYGRRWYILFMFSMIGVVQGILYNTWGPIHQSAKLVYGWSNTEIALIFNMGIITYAVVMFPVSYIMDVKGLRVAVITCNALMVVGTGMRCITMVPIPATWMNNIGQLLIGIAGCVPFGGPALMSSVWFPVSQRTTAISIAMMFCYLGDGVAFIIGPLLVRQLGWTEITQSLNQNQSAVSTLPPAHNVSNNTDVYEIKRQEHDLLRLFYIEVGCTAALLLLSICYFPSKPPSPPSKSALMDRMGYRQGFSQLIRSSQLWLINLTFCAPVGVFTGWLGLIGIVLSPVGISQEEAGWIGLYTILGGCVSGVLVARFADMFASRMKLILFALYAAATLSTTWFILLTDRFIPFSTVQLYLSCILVGVFMTGTVSLFVEMACETAFPIAEGITSGYITLVQNFVSAIFLFVAMIPNIGTAWMTWALLGSVFIGLPFILALNGTMERRKIDTDINIVVDVNNPKQET